jgi:hypothetical protein
MYDQPTANATSANMPPAMADQVQQARDSGLETRGRFRNPFRNFRCAYTVSPQGIASSGARSRSVFSFFL